MERAVVHGVHTRVGQAVVTVTGVVDRAAAVAWVFRSLARRGVEPGIVSGGEPLVFTVPAAEACRAAATLRSARARIGFTTCGVTDKVALIILDGAGLRTDPQVIVTFCGSLILSGVRLSLVSAEAGHITAVCPENRLPAVVAALREAFEIHPIDEVPDRDRAAAPLAS